MKIHRVIVSVATEDSFDHGVLVGAMQNLVSTLKAGRFSEASVTGSDERPVKFPDLPSDYTDVEAETWLDRAEDEIYGRHS